LNSNVQGCKCPPGGKAYPTVVGEAGMLTKPEGFVDDPPFELWRLTSLVIDCQRRRSRPSTMSTCKGMNGVPTSDCDVSPVRNTGSPTGRESYGDRVLIVVVEVTLHQGDGKTVRRAKQDRKVSSFGVSGR
jgi:hypothetical protein